MTARPRWRDPLSRHAPVLAALVLFGASMLAARSFATPGGGPSSSSSAPGPGGPTGAYTGPELTGIFVSCIPDCDLIAVSTGIGRRLTQTDRAVDESAPSLSPDGRRVAFRCAEPAVEPGPGVASPRPASPGRICVIDIPESGDEPIGPTTTLLEDEAIDYGAPAWSPDGATIAYDVHASDGTSGIGLFDVASGEHRVVTDLDDGVSNPAWSPDGEQLAFGCATDQEGSDKIRSRFCGMPSKGGPVTLLGEVEGTCGAPSYSPDATFLGVVCMTPGAEGGDLFRVSLAEPLVRSLTGSRRIAPEGLARPAWSPDGRFAYVRSDDALYAIALPEETWSRPPLVDLHGDFDVRVAE
jgi:Tol biopolymer transport system component